MSIPARRYLLGCLIILLVVSTALAGGGSNGTGEAIDRPPSSFLLSPAFTPVIPSLNILSKTPTSQPTPEFSILGASYDPSIDIKAGPVELPLVLQIPEIKVGAPVLGVGQSEDNAMDSPKGDWGDPAWSSAFWYRGSSIPGEPGTATITGHVNGLLGEAQTFYNLKKLRPGDLIIIHVKDTFTDILFTVDEVKRYSIQESSTPEVLTRIYGVGPTTGSAAEAGADGLSHLTLITCSGYYVDGKFDHHIVVYATRSN
jgi:hypothetical protein